MPKTSHPEKRLHLHTTTPSVNQSSSGAVSSQPEVVASSDVKQPPLELVPLVSTHPELEKSGFQTYSCPKTLKVNPMTTNWVQVRHNVVPSHELWADDLLVMSPIALLPTGADGRQYTTCRAESAQAWPLVMSIISADERRNLSNLDGCKAEKFAANLFVEIPPQSLLLLERPLGLLPLSLEDEAI
ncbi:unnamed protein product [Protopolystoma xenopodis]|uniref:Uncharacterized protein n=1 Tax=Protopolystoma xenopodis TaxID=117903 RepID=A0A448X1M5_9PLAT|nr:unnamed protein product [Protopolystoma xenopodis]